MSTFLKVWHCLESERGPPIRNRPSTDSKQCVLSRQYTICHPHSHCGIVVDLHYSRDGVDFSTTVAARATQLLLLKAIRLTGRKTVWCTSRRLSFTHATSPLDSGKTCMTTRGHDGGFPRQLPEARSRQAKRHRHPRTCLAASRL